MGRISNKRAAIAVSSASLAVFFVSSCIWTATEGDIRFNPHWKNQYHPLNIPAESRNILNEVEIKERYEWSEYSKSFIKIPDYIRINREYAHTSTVIDGFHLGGYVEIYNIKCQEKYEEEQEDIKWKNIRGKYALTGSMGIITGRYREPPQKHCVISSYPYEEYVGDEFVFDVKLLPNIKGFLKRFTLFSVISLSISIVSALIWLFWAPLTSWLTKPE